MRILKLLYDDFFRVEAYGLENIPKDGPVLLVGNHAGYTSHDALMTMVAVRFSPASRRIRSLFYNGLEKLPFIGYASTNLLGGVIGHPRNAEYLLSKGEALLTYPEGGNAADRSIRDGVLIKRQHFSSGFARIACKNGIPVLPVAAVGFEKIAPVLFHSKILGRLFKVKKGRCPITPQSPFILFIPNLIPIVPFPAKCYIEFGNIITPERHSTVTSSDEVTLFTDMVFVELNDLIKKLDSRRHNSG